MPNTTASTKMTILGDRLGVYRPRVRQLAGMIDITSGSSQTGPIIETALYKTVDVTAVAKGGVTGTLTVRVLTGESTDSLNRSCRTSTGGSGFAIASTNVAHRTFGYLDRFTRLQVIASTGLGDGSTGFFCDGVFN